MVLKLQTVTIGTAALSLAGNYAAGKPAQIARRTMPVRDSGVNCTVAGTVSFTGHCALNAVKCNATLRVTLLI